MVKGRRWSLEGGSRLLEYVLASSGILISLLPGELLFPDILLTKTHDTLILGICQDTRNCLSFLKLFMAITVTLLHCYLFITVTVMKSNHGQGFPYSDKK